LTRERASVVLAHILLFLALGALSAGCRRRSAAPPPPLDITPRATVSPASVPAGGPIAIDYLWSVGPTATPLTGRYRAFVHFLDDEGALLFTDDHAPAPPPSEWQAGQSYSYRRVTLTAEFPFVGTAKLVVGLYDADSGARVPLAGADAGQRRIHVADPVLRPRDLDRRVRCDGFYEPEAPLAAPLVVSRFMGRQVDCRFPNPREDVVLFVRADIEPQAFSAPPRLRITSDARAAVTTWYAGELPLSSEPALVHVPVAARLLGRGADATFRLSMSETYRPAAFGGGDPRELSLRVFGLHAVPAALLDPALRAEQGELLESRGSAQ
jgi:hypothetical protein